MGAACSQRTIWLQGHTWKTDFSSWDERAEGKAIGDETKVGGTRQDEEVSPHTHFLTFSDFPFTQFSQLKDFIPRTPPTLSLHPLLSPGISSLYSIFFHEIFQWCLKQNFSYTFCFHDGSDGKESACSARDPGLIPGLGRSLGKESGNPLQYSCLENSLDRGAWRASVYRVAKSQTQLRN